MKKSDREKLVEPHCKSGSGERAEPNLELGDLITRGLHSFVHKAKLRGNEVVVKFVDQSQSIQFDNECKLFLGLNHMNILKYIDCNPVYVLSSTMYHAIIFDYHPLGSLHDYLKKNVLDESRFYQMAIGIMDGLKYLHMECRRLSKLPIAHRDLKSQNILVKNSLDCCICDLGLSVRSDGFNQYSVNRNQGTIRYMAPETLKYSTKDSTKASTKELKFELLLQGDMYSIALVIWEMLNRSTLCKLDSVDEYRQPYFDKVQATPTVDEMKKIVCDEKCRPLTNTNWGGLSPMLEQCWQEDPASRPKPQKLMSLLQRMNEERQ